MGKKISVKNVIKFSGAYIAYMIGSGFATGQEIVQFYTSFSWKSIGAILVSMVLFAGAGGLVMSHGFDCEAGQEGKAYQHFCGKYLGRFYEIFVTFFLFCVVVIMISGAGATLNEYYGLNYYVGCLIMAALIYVAYILGLKGLVNIIGCIGPAIILFTIIVGFITIFRNGLNVPAISAEQQQTLADSQAASHWLISGILYAGYNTFGSIIFLTALGKEAQSREEARWGGILGGVILMCATLVMNIAFLTDLGEVVSFAIPTLHLADQISPVIGVIFSVILFSGIFSTAAPMTWTVCSKLTEEGTTRSKIIAAVVIGVAFVCGQLPFGTLVGIVYPYTGYLGMLLFICLIITAFKGKAKDK